MIRIHAMTVSVNYADMLRRTLPRWMPGFESLTVVTTHQDKETEAACAAYPNITLLQTQSFFDQGAVFNKGAAMEEGWGTMTYFLERANFGNPVDDWILFFDPDILPPVGWYVQLEQQGKLDPTKLYGTHRWQADADYRDDIPGKVLPQIPDEEWPGYFQLFHSSDPCIANADPLFDVTWRHAGGYDSVFQDRWGIGHRSDRKVRLPLYMIHLGPTGNWWGRSAGGQAKMRDMEKRRKTNRGILPEEKLR